MNEGPPTKEKVPSLNTEQKKEKTFLEKITTGKVGNLVRSVGFLAALTAADLGKPNEAHSQGSVTTTTSDNNKPGLREKTIESKNTSTVKEIQKLAKDIKDNKNTESDTAKLAEDLGKFFTNYNRLVFGMENKFSRKERGSLMAALQGMKDSLSALTVDKPKNGNLSTIINAPNGAIETLIIRIDKLKNKGGQFKSTGVKVNTAKKSFVPKKVEPETGGENKPAEGSTSPVKEEAITPIDSNTNKPESNPLGLGGITNEEIRAHRLKPIKAILDKINLEEAKIKVPEHINVWSGINEIYENIKGIDNLVNLEKLIKNLENFRLELYYPKKGIIKKGENGYTARSYDGRDVDFLVKSSKEIQNYIYSLIEANSDSKLDNDKLNACKVLIDLIINEKISKFPSKLRDARLESINLRDAEQKRLEEKPELKQQELKEPINQFVPYEIDESQITSAVNWAKDVNIEVLGDIKKLETQKDADVFLKNVFDKFFDEFYSKDKSLKEKKQNYTEEELKFLINVTNQMKVTLGELSDKKFYQANDPNIKKRFSTLEKIEQILSEEVSYAFQKGLKIEKAAEKKKSKESFNPFD